MEQICRLARPSSATSQKKGTHAHALGLTTGLSPSAFNLPITGNSQVNNSHFNSHSVYLHPRYISPQKRNMKIPVSQTINKNDDENKCCRGRKQTFSLKFHFQSSFRLRSRTLRMLVCNEKYE